MKGLQTLVALLLGLSLSAALLTSGCDRGKREAERVDKPAVTQPGDRVEGDLERAGERTGETLERTGERTGETLERAGERTGEAVEGAGQRTEEALENGRTNRAP